MVDYYTEEGLAISHIPVQTTGLLTPEEMLAGISTPEGYAEMSLTEEERSQVMAYPFTLITEAYQAGKTYGGKAIETIKNIVAYPYEKLTEVLATEKPTGILKKEFDLEAFLKSLFKPPWIFLLLGIGGLYVYSVFKKR